MTALHLGRYSDLARLLLKHGRSDLFQVGDDGGDSAATVEDATALAADLEAMGPTFVKLGQLLSTRADLLPPVYLEALRRLQDHVEPIPFADVERIVTAELGVRLSKAFQDFDVRPAASASLGQVHRAHLRDGRAVAVKVQRPDIKARIVEDMEVIDQVASFVDEHTKTGHHYGFAAMAEQFRRSLMDELDYRKEAQNLVVLHRNLREYDRIVIPTPVDDYTTSLVLTMDWVPGRNLSSLGPLGRLELNGEVGEGLARDLFRAYLDQILVDGFFHADPHPGNVLLTDDARLAVVDLGMVARVSPDNQDKLIKLLLAVSAGRGGDAADVMVALGDRLDGFDPDAFRLRISDLISHNLVATVGDVQAGAVIGQLLRASADAGLRPPSELTMMGKALLNLDEVARILAPNLVPNAEIERHAGDIMRHKLLASASPANAMAAVMEAKEFAEKLPGRVNKVMDALAEGQLTLNVQGIDEKELMRGVQKLANRVTAGLVIAALVIGAALMMRINTPTKLFGYPALAIVLFTIAAGAAGSLLLTILLSDLPQRRGRGRQGDR